MPPVKVHVPLERSKFEKDHHTFRAPMYSVIRKQTHQEVGKLAKRADFGDVTAIDSLQKSSLGDFSAGSSVRPQPPRERGKMHE